MLAILPAPLFAQEDDFTARAVPIETNGTTATDARNQAMVDIEEKAFRQLIEERAPTEAQSILSSVSRTQISGMVQGIEIEQEKISGTQYRALMSVSFSPYAVRSLLGNKAAAAPVAPAGTATLLLPVYTADGRAPVLLEGDNPWKKAWDNASLATLSLPVGDLEDVTLATVNNAGRGTFATLSPLANKYHAKDILVADARLEQDTMNNTLILHVTLKELSAMDTTASTLVFRGLPGQDAGALLAYAVKDILSQRQGTQADLLKPSHDVAVTVPYNQLNEWVRAKQRIKSIRAIEKMEVTHIGARHANLLLSTRKSDEELIGQFQQNGFTTSVSPGGATVVKLVGF